MERQVDRLLLELAELQDDIWDGLEELEKVGEITPEVEEHVRQVMGDISYWADQCTSKTKSTPVLLRRMEVHISRLIRTRDLLKELRDKVS